MSFDTQVKYCQANDFTNNVVQYKHKVKNKLVHEFGKYCLRGLYTPPTDWPTLTMTSLIHCDVVFVFSYGE